MNDATFSCSHFSNSHSFLSAGKQFEMWKRSQESFLFAWISNGESKSMLSRFATMRICGTRLFEPQKPGSARDSLVWTWEERSAKSGWYSVQHASGNREYGSADSGGLSQTHASGNREYTRKSLSKHERPTQTRWKQLGHIDELREDAHLDVDEIYGFIDAGSIAPGPKLRK